MEEYSSNCYGFIHAGLINSKDKFYLFREDAFKGVNGIKNLGEDLSKIQHDSSESILDCLSDDPENQFSVLEIFDGNKTSQHVAFIDKNGNFYDQDDPRGKIRLGRNIDYLLDEYKSILGTAYFQIHILDKDLSTNVEKFLEKQEGIN